MVKASKSRISKFKYVSPSQLTLEGFDTPFAQNLDSNNRWVVLAKAIPRDSLTANYSKQLNYKIKGADSINLQVAVGSLIIKHIITVMAVLSFYPQLVNDFKIIFYHSLMLINV